MIAQKIADPTHTRNGGENEVGVGRPIALSKSINTFRIRFQEKTVVRRHHAVCKGSKAINSETADDVG